MRRAPPLPASGSLFATAATRRVRLNQPARSPAVAGMLNKVPEVTLAFWIVKIMSTTVGETGADYLAVHVGLGAAVTGALTACLLVGALALQWRARAYVPWIYWLNIVLVSVAGTQITDALTDGLGVSLHVSTPLFAAALAATFALWYRSERTLSIHTIVTPRREGFYWAAILLTFALVAAAALGGMNRVLAFWLAYILTRPLGASLGDFLSQAQAYGGLGLGTIRTSAVFLAVIVALVAGLSVAAARAGRLGARGR